jgi:ketosteroid isomerase-like protein
MRNFTLLLTLIAATLLIASCSQTATDSRPEAEAAVRAADEQWSAAAAKNDVDATVSYYSDDAVLMPPNAPIATEKPAIRNDWAGMLGPNTAISWKANKVEAAKSGDLAYAYGTYQLAIKDPKGGPGVNDKGKFAEVWKKQADGKWKCALDIFNSDIPVPSPPAPETKKK